MSKDSQQPQQPEEVDLGQLFKLIGNAFDRLFRLIGNILNKIFLAFVWTVFFVKRHVIKIVLAGIIGFGYGFFKQKKGEPIYKSTTVIKQNYETGENLYRSIEYYNELINDKDTVTLGNLLGIEPSTAGSIINLEIESVVTNNDKLKTFDLYIKSIDSTLASTVTLDEFISNSKEYDHPVQRLIIRAKERGAFGPIISKTIDNINNTEYFITEQKKDLDQLTQLENSIKQSLEVSNELKEVYKKVLVEVPSEKRLGSQTSIRIDNTEDKNITKEYELYTNDVELRRELVEIRRKKEDKDKIIEVVSSQQNQGTIDNTKQLLGKTIDSKIYYTIILMLLASVLLLSLHFIKFLEKYKGQI